MQKSDPSVRDVLLTRRGLVFLEDRGTLQAPLGAGIHSDERKSVRGLELELANLGYVVSTRLSARLESAPEAELSALRESLPRALLAQVGGDRKHVPLFRKFPGDVPSDTTELWWRRVLVHFLQAEDQPCIFCAASATTHVLNPCRHVICDRCFDGANYSACPCCGRHPDRSSPFFLDGPQRDQPVERVQFRRLDLGDDFLAAAKSLFEALCERKQALSPDDRQALTVLVRELGERVLPWLPRTIFVRENIATIFGTLFQVCNPSSVLPQAARFMTTATDVLRFLAVFSGTDGSLQREVICKSVEVVDERTSPMWALIEKFLGGRTMRVPFTAVVPIRVNRFKVAKLSRSLRRAMLALLERIEPARLIEDMMRHQSWWVWAGEFIHPGEYAARFPNVSDAFRIVRKKSKDGVEAPRFHGFYSRLNDAVEARNVPELVALLSERPGEFARRFDHVLRLAGDDSAMVVQSFEALVAEFATPVLLTLKSHLTTRAAPLREGPPPPTPLPSGASLPVRVYWPKGKVGLGVSDVDRRAPLSPTVVARAVGAIDGELLRRFSTRSHFARGIVDEALRSVVVPFNERTASPSAVALPRGSRVAVPSGKVARLFLHWCQPERGGWTTDLDLSVGFYDEDWSYKGVCSYYELQMVGDGGEILAQSAGDLTSAPWPDGASEFIDLHWERAEQAEIRYAVMVINAYSGMSFSQLERAFAGVMLREDLGGTHFDARTVELKFNLQGENGVYMPLVLDIRERTIHWLDVHAKGQLALNNVATSNKDITKICPELMAYFSSGARLSMYDLALLHVAARCTRVELRGDVLRVLERGATESVETFYARLREPRGGGASDGHGSRDSGDASPDAPALAILFRGDLELAPGSAAYALFRERVNPTLAASDLVS